MTNFTSLSKSLFATSFDISISSFSKDVEMYSNFINIIFEHYLPYYYDTTLTNYIPTYAKIYRILSEHVKSRKINRCDPCQIYCLVDEDETQNQVHFQGTMGSKVGCFFPMAVVYLLSHTEFGPNDHREEAPHLYFDSLSDSLVMTELKF